MSAFIPSELMSSLYPGLRETETDEANLMQDDIPRWRTRMHVRPLP